MPNNMNAHSSFCIFFFVVLTNLIAHGQGLIIDKTIFEREVHTYQQWLDHSGIGKTLKVHAIQVEEDVLSLFLAFHTDNSNECWAYWNQLKVDFATKKSISLEQKLFYKLVTIMDIQQTEANVQIYDTYDLSKEPCFVQEIKFNEGSKTVIVEESGCRYHAETLVVKPNKLEGLNPSSEATSTKLLAKEKVFDRIIEWAKQKYETALCEGRTPKVNILENNEVLRFKVEDLCLEVLQDQKNPILCWMIDKVCYKRERLTYTFSYTKESEIIKLNIEIDGRYGSGFYDKVGRAGYHLMDNDYLEELVEYTQERREELRSVLR